MSLYTKYRPRDWDSVVSQDYITNILRNSLRHDRVNHAYLFHGSRGTGKTTSARILAKAVNCLHLRDGNPCHECSNCQAFDSGMMLDIIEIDAASNTGVDNIRELIEKARFEPNQWKYKVYIIDEVHMLSTGAFNALLKILEEPPAHVKFILATTEIEKVLETIRSRTLRFDFRKITIENIIERLLFVTKKEWLEADDEAIELIAKSARGWLRDALTLLEQNIIDNHVRIEHVRHTLALVDEALIEDTIHALVHQNLWVQNYTSQEYTIQSTGGILWVIEKIREKHIDARGFFDQLFYRIRDLMIEHIDDDDMFVEYSEILRWLEEAYGKLKFVPESMMLIEITLLRIAKRGIPREQKKDPQWLWQKERTGSTLAQTPLIPPQKDTPQWEIQHQDTPISADTPTHEIPNTLQDKITNPPAESIEEKNDSESSSLISLPTIPFSFPHLIKILKESSPALAVDMKTARFTLSHADMKKDSSLHDADNTLSLIFSKKWNYDRVNSSTAKNIISENCAQSFGGRWTVVCELNTWTNTNISDGIF